MFTGYTRDGGFATAVIADAQYVLALGESGSDAALAPLLCAGLIGGRALAIGGEGKKIGLYGFGAAAHIVAQVAKFQGRTVYAFTRPDDSATQVFPRELGVHWAGGTDQTAPEQLDVAIIFAPVGGINFLRLAAHVGVVIRTSLYPLTDANRALVDLRAGRFEGAAVVVPDE